MKALWSPRSVAVVGAGRSSASLGNRVVRYLRDHGYGGCIYPVNPKYSHVEDLVCYSDMVSIDGPVDLALVMVGAESVMRALKDCALKGVRYAVIHASGFSETGAAGQALEAELVSFARANGMRIVGPNCIGLVSAADRLVAGFSPLFSRVRFAPGNLALVTQSGAIGYGIVSLALEQGLAFSRIVNTGNEADLTAADFVRDLLEDEATQAVLVYAEGLKGAEACRELGALSHKAGKPIIILKAGRSAVGERAAVSHTAALAGDDAVWDAAFRQLGMIRVEDVEEMLDVAAAFAQPRRPAGERVGVVTTSGGAGILAADALASAGLSVPELTGETRANLEAIVPAFGSAANPVDVTAQVINDSELFRRALRAMAADPALDLLLACFCVLQGEEAERVVDDLLAVHAETGKPLLVSRTGAEALAPGAAARLQASGVPVSRTPARASRAAGALARFARHRLPAAAAPLAPAGPAPQGWPALLPRLPDLLAAHGLPVARELPAASPEEAARAAETLGFPVALKVDDPAIPHKTEAGGVHLNLSTPDEVRRAWQRIGAPRCTVQEQVLDPVAEILVGVTPSPMGPVVTVGLGGIFAEVLGDVARRLAPVTPDEALTMLGELKGYPLLTGARGRPAADLGSLAAVIVKVSELAVTWPGRWELDLNPVLALRQGARIVDALLVVHDTEEGSHADR